MESLNIPESFEDFRNRIAEIFKSEGLSENLNFLIKEWEDKLYVFMDRYGSTIEERTLSKIQIAQVYAVIERYDDVWDLLTGAWELVDEAGLIELKKEVENMLDLLMERK